MRLQARDNLSTPVGEKMVSLFNSIKIQRRKRKIEIQRNMKVTWVAWKCSLKTALTLFFSLLHLAERNISFTHSPASGFLQCGSTHWPKAKQRERGRKQNGNREWGWWKLEANRVRWIWCCASLLLCCCRLCSVRSNGF